MPSDTPARPATAAVEVPAKPRSAKRRRAAPMMRARLSAGLRVRPRRGALALPRPALAAPARSGDLTLRPSGSREACRENHRVVPRRPPFECASIVIERSSIGKGVASGAQDLSPSIHSSLGGERRSLVRNPDPAPRSSSAGRTSPGPRPAPPWQRLAAALVLLVATIAVFAPSFEFGLVEYDDPLYVRDVPLVQRGLTGEGLRWAFTTFQAWNWHPLTWISLMGDVELFGQDPKSLHRTNVALHVANALLVFALLGSATQAWGRSFFAAGLFALHPLHVESVAWVAERKDVLSTFFALLTLGAYFAYARRGGALRYTGVCLLFAWGLMAKPMLVTLPA